MPQVQVLSPRPENKGLFHTDLYFFVCVIEFNLRYFKLTKQLWEQVTEPSAAGGGFSEAEEEKNKENREALQASEATMFFLVVRRFKSCRLDQNHKVLKPLIYKGFGTFLFLQIRVLSFRFFCCFIPF